MSFVEFYMSVGNMLGLASPFKRFLFGTVAGFAVQLVVRPSISYRKDGSAKALGETLLPWYVISVLPGILFALFF